MDGWESFTVGEGLAAEDERSEERAEGVDDDQPEVLMERVLCWVGGWVGGLGGKRRGGNG